MVHETFFFVDYNGEEAPCEIAVDAFVVCNQAAKTLHTHLGDTGGRALLPAAGWVENYLPLLLE